MWNVWFASRRKVHTVGNAMLWLKRKVLPLPWWFVLVGYATALAAVGVCIYFIVVFGAILGETLATQWLIAMLVGTLESVVVEQPLKVHICVLLTFTYKKLTFTFSYALCLVV